MWRGKWVDSPLVELMLTDIWQVLSVGMRRSISGFDPNVRWGLEGEEGLCEAWGWTLKNRAAGRSIPATDVWGRGGGQRWDNASSQMVIPTYSRPILADVTRFLFRRRKSSAPPTLMVKLYFSCQCLRTNFFFFSTVGLLKFDLIH